MPRPTFKNPDIAVFALYLLGGATDNVNHEDLAVKCWEMAPERFSWLRHPYPNADSVRRELSRAKQRKPARVAGGRDGGWRLTEHGVRWVKHNKTGLEASVARPTSEPSRKKELQENLSKLRATAAYQRFSQEGTACALSESDIGSILNVNIDTPKTIVTRRISTLRANATQAEDNDALNFLKALENVVSSNG